MEKSWASLYMDMNVLMILMIFLLKIDNNDFVINSLIWFRGHDMVIYLSVFYTFREGGNIVHELNFVTVPLQIDSLLLLGHCLYNNGFLDQPFLNLLSITP